MIEVERRRNETLKRICNETVMVFPQAAGMAMTELDCGCLLVCGVTFTGEPIGPLRTLDRRELLNDRNQPVCLVCRKGGNRLGDRMVAQGLVWPGDATELPDRELRIFIGQQVFGAAYTEPA